MLPATVKAINQNQMKGQTPDPQLIQDPDMRHLVEKFNLMEEMFGNKAAGQVEANKQVSHLGMKFSHPPHTLAQCCLTQHELS